MSKSSDEDTVDQLRQATREARECLKDFRAVIKEYNDLIGEWKEYVNERIDTDIRNGLERYHSALEKAITQASSAVYARFDKIYNLLTTGGNKNEPPIPELVEEYVRIKNKKH